MNRVVDISFIHNTINSYKRIAKNSIHNFYLSSEKIEHLIKEKKLWYHLEPNTTFLFKENDEFYNLYYISNGIDKLKDDLILLNKKYLGKTFVSDILTKQIDDEILNVFNQANYNQYGSLIRMYRTSEKYSSKIETDSDVVYACLSDINSIYEYYTTFFDKKIEQVPSYDELVSYINKENVLIYKENQNIIAFLIFQIMGATTYLRYWFVHPDYRNKKIGSKLLKHFFDKGKDSSRQILWVIQTNDDAIQKYTHYGFVKENLFNYVVVNKNIKYV